MGLVISFLSADWKIFRRQKSGQRERVREKEKEKSRAYNLYLPRIESCKITSRGIVV